MSANRENKTIELTGSITVRDLSNELKASPIDVIKNLMANGVMANINQLIDFDTASIVAAEFGYEVILKSLEVDTEEDTSEIPLWRRMIAREDQSTLTDRPPVVTILGHVDHGKTTLLDAIRLTSVAAGEVGGITQHIGAYQVTHHDRTITFLDTPGHAAFSAMRARGAQGADIVVLVIAADDGVMPQTKEAIAHARAAKVPMIVAMNKMDRSNAEPERVKQQLAEIGLVPDEWDGDTIIVPLSAIKKEGLEDLLEAILLVSDNLDIQANTKGDVFGSVIEAKIERGRGVMATLLVQNGTLETGDVVVAGTAYGKIKAMFNFLGASVDQATPSTPVSVMGLNEVPDAGDLFRIAEFRKNAREIVKERQVAAEEKRQAKKQAITLEQIFERFQLGEAKELRLIIKADVQGSLEPIISSLRRIGSRGNRGKHPARRHRQYQRKRCYAGFCLQCGHRWFQCTSRFGCLTHGRDGRHFDPYLQHHLPPDRRYRESPERAFGARGKESHRGTSGSPGGFQGFPLRSGRRLPRPGR